jgi:hypothetical protein
VGYPSDAVASANCGVDGDFWAPKTENHAAEEKK